MMASSNEFLTRDAFEGGKYEHLLDCEPDEDLHHNTTVSKEETKEIEEK
jgi:hypothetical protein